MQKDFKNYFSNLKNIKMNTYYITEQLIYKSADSNNFHAVDYCNEGTNIMFRADVFTNALNNNPKVNYLCGLKIKDDVLVTLPVNTPRIVF
jgi:hypothetical protein